MYSNLESSNLRIFFKQHEKYFYLNQDELSGIINNINEIDVNSHNENRSNDIINTVQNTTEQLVVHENKVYKPNQVPCGFIHTHLTIRNMLENNQIPVDDDKKNEKNKQPDQLDGFTSYVHQTQEINTPNNGPRITLRINANIPGPCCTCQTQCPCYKSNQDLTSDNCPQNFINSFKPDNNVPCVTQPPLILTVQSMLIKSNNPLENSTIETNQYGESAANLGHSERKSVESGRHDLAAYSEKLPLNQPTNADEELKDRSAFIMEPVNLFTPLNVIEPRQKSDKINDDKSYTHLVNEQMSTQPEQIIGTELQPFNHFNGNQPNKTELPPKDNSNKSDKLNHDFSHNGKDTSLVLSSILSEPKSSNTSLKNTAKAEDGMQKYGKDDLGQREKLLYEQGPEITKDQELKQEPSGNLNTNEQRKQDAIMEAESKQIQQQELEIFNDQFSEKDKQESIKNQIQDSEVRDKNLKQDQSSVIDVPESVEEEIIEAIIINKQSQHVIQFGETDIPTNQEQVKLQSLEERPSLEKTNELIQQKEEHERYDLVGLNEQVPSSQKENQQEKVFHHDQAQILVNGTEQDGESIMKQDKNSSKLHSDQFDDSKQINLNDLTNVSTFQSEQSKLESLNGKLTSGVHRLSAGSDYKNNIHTNQTPTEIFTEDNVLNEKSDTKNQLPETRKSNSNLKTLSPVITTSPHENETITVANVGEDSSPNDHGTEKQNKLPENPSSPHEISQLTAQQFSVVPARCLCCNGVKIFQLNSAKVCQCSNYQPTNCCVTNVANCQMVRKPCALILYNGNYYSETGNVMCYNTLSVCNNRRFQKSRYCCGNTDDNRLPCSINPYKPKEELETQLICFDDKSLGNFPDNLSKCSCSKNEPKDDNNLQHFSHTQTFYPSNNYSGIPISCASIIQPCISNMTNYPCSIVCSNRNSFILPSINNSQNCLCHFPVNSNILNHHSPNSEK